MENIKKQINYSINMFIGTAVVAVPMGFMDEVTNLSENIPTLNIILIVLLSVLSLVLFYQMHSKNEKKKRIIFLVQVLGSYTLSIFITAFLLGLFMQSPWENDTQVALNQIFIVGYPASLAGAIAVSLFKKR